MKLSALSFLAMPLLSLALPAQECPKEFATSGWMNDLGLLSDGVSWGDLDYKDPAVGICGTYEVVKTCEAKYQTRMRIYSSKKDKNVAVVAFRPTQQNSEGGAIHDNRQMVPCTFLNKGNCSGLVHERFQEAFLELMDNCKAEVNKIKNKHVFVTGHSLGGAMSLFFSLHLWKDLGKLPVKSIGFAGPFIGDEEFSNAYQEPMKALLGDNWWQVESVNKNNVGEFDGTVEGYNVNHDGPQIYIEQDAICGAYINPLPVDYNQGGSPNYSYGMHDLKNYRLLLKGTECKSF